MPNPRINFSPAQKTALVAQVDRICPLCAEPLFYQKNKKSYVNYEIAHIYPLNAKPHEKDLLGGEEILGDDLNDEENLIPLCKICHGKYDKPRTVSEYRELVSIKKKIIEKGAEEEHWKRYHIEDQVSAIIDALYDDSSLDIDPEIDFSPKEVDEKLDDSMSEPTHRKIKRNVQDYFFFVRGKFQDLDETGELVSESVSLQVKAFYVRQKAAGRSQQVAFDNIVDWLNAKTRPETRDGAEILASFFVQNCEIF